MTLRRLTAIMGFCFMLVAATSVTHLFFTMWVYDVDRVQIYVDVFDERSVELLLVFVGYCLIPITIYEFDRVLWQRDEA